MSAPVVEPSGLVGLVGRVEAATGADRELDCLVECEWRNRLLSPSAFARQPWARMGPFSDYVSCGGYSSTLAPHYTASLDAALALCERVLPGWCVLNLAEWEDDRLRAKGPWMAQLKLRNVWSPVPNGASCMNAKTPALALLAAMLKALIAQAADTSEGEGIGSSVARSGGSRAAPVKSDSAEGH